MAATMLCSAADATSNLRQLGASKGIFIGSAAGLNELKNNERYADVLAREFSLITAENSCKWSATEPQQGQFDFKDCDTILEFAEANNITFRGHNLAWGMFNPQWLDHGKFSTDQKRQLLVNHIQTVLKHYEGRVRMWDVVNEAINDADWGPVLKNNTWYPDVPDYVDVAFRTAREADPKVKLFYNDYNVSASEGYMVGKSQRVYDMLKSMKQRGVPVDGLGVQLHIDISFDFVEGIKANMRRLGELGLELHITELDVSCHGSGLTPGACPQWGQAQAEQQANVYAALMQVCLEEPACTNFEVWGFTDKYTWMGTQQHPLLFDENFSKKPAYYSLIRTMEQNDGATPRGLIV